MKILAVVGSRDFPHMDKVSQWVHENAKGFDHFVSGGASGVDTVALMAWREIMGSGLDKVYKADWQRYGKGAGMIRNIKIITKATFAAVFWTSHSDGTLDDLGLLLVQDTPFNLYVR